MTFKSLNFEDLGLREELLRAIAQQGYDRPTPIQEQAIPIILEGRDVLAGAQTGTGKNRRVYLASPATSQRFLRSRCCAQCS
ncbi:MAG: DEAD/DEAH box helicase [Synechococcales cyanobacterium CRU_2_2]|nr:DEAD/DEAH box helicase [Synechococcales cyanobacterium CRU_2_2]